MACKCETCRDKENTALEEERRSPFTRTVTPVFGTAGASFRRNADRTRFLALPWAEPNTSGEELGAGEADDGLLADDTEDEEALAELEDRIELLDSSGLLEGIGNEESGLLRDRAGEDTESLNQRFGLEGEVLSSVRHCTSLASDQRNWVLSLDRSAIERLPDAKQRERFLNEIDWAKVEFPGNKPKDAATTKKLRDNWRLADELFNALAGVTAERRVPSIVRYRNVAHLVVPVPRESGQKLFPEACDAYIRMRDCAAADGVTLSLTSSWRTAQRQRDIQKSQPNPKAVARNFSTHMYGLAIDLSMSVPGLRAGISTRSSEKMARLIRMYRSPVYKWMALRAKEFGWYPYRREPWHWEYNPPGFKERFEGAPTKKAPTALDQPSHPQQQPSPSSVSPPRTEGAHSWLPLRILDAVRSGILNLDTALMIAAGERNIDKLTNAVFYAKHPELPADHKIGPHEKQLARHWRDIRDRIVDPLLKQLGADTPETSGSTRFPAIAVPWSDVPLDKRIIYVMKLLVGRYAYPVNGAAGIVGNLLKESAVLPNRIQGSNASTPMTAPNIANVDTTFTAEQVMNLGRHGPKHRGIGLLQWTYPSRRSGLFRHEFRGQVLGPAILYNMDAQVDYLVSELKADYGPTNSLLRKPDTSLEHASDEVLYDFARSDCIMKPSGGRLPRDDPKVQGCFRERRGYGQKVLRVYRDVDEGELVAADDTMDDEQYDIENTQSEQDFEVPDLWETDSWEEGEMSFEPEGPTLGLGQSDEVQEPSLEKQPLNDHRPSTHLVAPSGVHSPKQENTNANAVYADEVNEAELSLLAGPFGNPIAIICQVLRFEKERWERVKREMVRIAKEEFQITWNNGADHETDTAKRAVIEGYWREGVYSGGAIPGHVSVPRDAWSAAFIAWVVKRAGGGDRFSKVHDEVSYRTMPHHGFRPSAHWRYFVPSKMNRDMSSINPFWAFPVTGAGAVTPQRGDIVIKSRDGSGVTYGFDFVSRGGRKTHGDIVVDVGTSDITVIGGNAGPRSDSVFERTLTLDGDGLIQSTGGAHNDQFAIVRINTNVFDLTICRASKSV